MPWQRAKPKPKVVRKRLADGTVKEYRYDRYPAAKMPLAQDTLAALIRAWQASPEWQRLSPKAKEVYVLYARELAPLGGFQATMLDRRSIRSIRDGIAAKGKPGAANGFVCAISALCGWGVKADRLPFNPAIGIQSIPGKPLPAWTRQEADRAIRDLSPHLARACLLALHTGQRRGDLCAMLWSAYDGDVIRLVQSKTGVRLVIPCHPDLKAAMDTWPRLAPTILTHSRGGAWRPEDLSAGLKAALDRMGFPKGRNIHGLRKLAATNLAEAGCSAHEIAAITGHRTLSMVQHYTQSADQERLALAAMNRLRRDRNGNRLETGE